MENSQVQPIEQFVEDLPEDEEIPRKTAHLFKKGQSGNPSGRPKGITSIKEYAKRMFYEMPDEDKAQYIRDLDEKRPGFMLTMAEGLPKEDKTINIKTPTPILGGITGITTQQIDSVVKQEVGNELLDDSSTQ